ncbi:LPS assembly protein LptD, partial [Candidatus Thioglobus sp.]|nr:LPS assembly protein LptD [Candidatus Thioglobus sp.]
DYQTLFPLEEFSTNADSLEIEADQSELLEGKYLLNGNVEVNSEKLYLAADDVEVSSIDNSLLATGNVRFQDEAYLITGDLLSATRDEDENLIATATNANYQDFGAGVGGANGYTESISKTSTSVLLKNSTYSLCPVNKNDWLIDADQIELNLAKNRGVADNAIIKFYGVPIFYLPKYSWVLSGRGSGFLTPNYTTYTDTATLPDASGKTKSSYSVRIPYYFNLAPDHDLLVALNYMSSRRFIYEGKYRQLIAPKLSPDHENSIWSLEAKYLPEDKVTSLKRWLVNFSNEMDINDKTHLSAQYYRVSDPEYFKEIDRTNTNLETLKSFLKLTYEDEENSLSASVLTEDDQIVNAGVPGYTRALEGSISKTFVIDTNQAEKKSLIKNKLKVENWKYPNITISTNFVSTKFSHSLSTKESGLRTNGILNISRPFAIKYPAITPNANINLTKYSLENSPNINRTVFGSGLNVDFTINNKTRIFGYKANHRITPLISYNYRAKKVQGNIPIFDTEDKYTDIISFADLTSGERYTGIDRITNANDITLSLESSYREVDALSEDKDLLNMRIAQTFYDDNEVVSATSSTDYETRKRYSDIAASIDIALGKYVITNSAQFNPDTSKIVKKENSLSYTSNSRKFITVSLSKVGSSSGVIETEKLYGAYPITDSIHFFGGLDKSVSTGITNSETTGLAYESCCWAFRVAHFKEDKGLGDGGFNYSTGIELVLSGLGSTSTPLKGRIENRIPGYTAKLR